MLTADTKRHIDAARQTLVGVVPNPETQIEQITNALIYKFMDDMDQAAIKAGDKPSFFVGELERYAWTRLMDSRVGNQERMNLYAEAIEKFSTSKQLPELFREIFRQAYLPFRSPEVLGLFLKEIDYFDYSHSEELGNAYEYLLSILSAQGDAGQFRTPRHIIDFIVDVVNPTKEDTVLDPACGTAGFLISAYNHILEQHKESQKPLTPADRRRLYGNFEGYDVSPEMVKLSRVNMYLHHFKNPKIYEYNTLSSEERWNDKFDVIMMNPPFMSPRGGVTPHSRFSVQSNRSEVLFVDYLMNHLKPHGRAGMIVPEGIMFQSGTSQRQLRENLVKDGLYAVVSLPSGVFNPYSGVKTSILFFDNEVAKHTKELLFVKVLNDGFDLGAQRRQIDKNDLPEALRVLRAWREHVLKGSDYLESAVSLVVPRKKIEESDDWSLSADRYQVAIAPKETKWPMVELGELIEPDFGVRITRSENEGTKYPVYGGGGESFRTDSFNRNEDTVVVARFAMSENCVRFVKAPFYLLDSGFTYHTKRPDVIKQYIDWLLLLRQDLVYSCARGQAQKNIDVKLFKSIKVPLPPIETQKKIVKAIEAEQARIEENKKQIDLHERKKKDSIIDVWE